MPQLQYLSKKDRKRARAKIKLAKQTVACEENQCGNKIQHEDFLSAMQHCGQLCELTGILYTIYHCETCGFAHVGHVDAPTVTWMMEGYAETVQTKLR
jgi:hypothetical protein